MEQTMHMFETIFKNMQNKRDFKQFAGVLLTGHPGTGKTTRINLLSKLLGIDLITVEAPHIVEEHIINIPFIVFTPEDDKTTTGSTKLTGDEYKVVLADSNLYSQLKKTRKVTDAQHLKNIYKSSRDVVELYEAMGGTQDELPEEIQEIRAQYSVILFLDEYFRQTSVRIRNMLRGILNGRIGAHEIPKNTYIIYATNLEDEGIEELPTNTQFKMVNLKNPSKDEWFSWLVYKFENDKHIKLKPEIINRFHHVLDDSDLSHDDLDSSVRTSPRRWEQIMLYLNSSLPVKDEADAIDLMSNIKTSFKNYQEGTHSNITDKVMKAVAKLIKETSGIEISDKATNTSADWRSTLKHQLAQKVKLGDKRKYVPIISGPPGIGKTAQAEHVANDLNLRFIDIDVSTINAEDVVGLPLPKSGGGEGRLETVFSIPSLYYQIMDRIKEEDKAYLAELKKKDSANFADAKAAYEKQPYKYLVFFDELNRNSHKVFNAIRRVLLEKNFGPSEDGKKLLELPKEVVMLGAINPHDVGAEALTKHMQDVLDIIDASGHWDKTVQHLKGQQVPGVDEGLHDLALDLVKKFAEKFQTKDHNISIKERHFYLDLGQQVYISPREYTMLFLNLARSLGVDFKKIKKMDLSALSPEEFQKLEDKLRQTIFNDFEEDLQFIFVKHGVDSDEFLNDLKTWILTSSDIDFGENLFYRKAVDTKGSSLMDIIGEHFDAANKTSMHENMDFINFMENVDLAKFREDLTDIAATRIIDEASAKKYIMDDAYDGKQLDGDNIKADPADKVSLVENFMREVIYALHINQMSNDKISTVAKGLYEAFKNFKSKNQSTIDDDLMNDIVMKLVGIRSRIVKLVKALPQ